VKVRRNPGIAGRRPDRKAIRQVEAKARNEAYAMLPVEEKARRNPKRFDIPEGGKRFDKKVST
jgi:hypothetical protein